MGLFVVWGKGFAIEDTTLPNGDVDSSVIGMDGDWDGISATSLRQMMNIAASHGVDEELWPVYDEDECPADAEAWADVHERSTALRSEFDILTRDPNCEPEGLVSPKD